MKTTHCPVCFSPLEAREVAPCSECGHLERELADLAAGKHTYAEYRIFGLPIVLCNFCIADFGSYDPSYFGLSAGRQVLNQREFVREVDPAAQPRYDKYCPACQHRLAFLEFLAAARARNSQSRNAISESDDVKPPEKIDPDE